MHEFIPYLLKEGYSLEEAQEFISYLDEKILGNPWNWFPKKPQPQQGLPKTGPSSRLPNRVLPPAGMTSASRRQGSTAGVRSTTMKDPYPSRLQPQAPKPQFGPGAVKPSKPTGVDIKPRFSDAGIKARNALRKPVAKPQGSGTLSNVARVASTVASLRNLNPVGVAAAVMAPRPTASGTLDAARKRGDLDKKPQGVGTLPRVAAPYKPPRPPADKKPEPKLSKAQSFDKAFKAARTSGKSGFVWNNKTYTTKLRGEEFMYDEYGIILDCLVESGIVSSYEDAERFYNGMSDEWVGNLIEQVTTQTQFKPQQSSGTTGINKAPAPPKLPAPKKKEPKIGSGTPGYKYGALEHVELSENPLVGLGIKAGLAAGTALAGKAVYDRAKGVAGKIQQQNVEKKKQIDTLLQRNSFEPEGEVIDERTRARKGQPRPARNRATEMIRKMPEVKKGLMTRSGKTVAQHEKERGVKKEPGAPTPRGETTADRLLAKKRRAEIAKAVAQRSQDNMSSRFD